MSAGSEAAPTLAEVLRDRRDLIVQRFVIEARQGELPPDGVAGALVIDHIPVFIDDMATELESAAAGRLSREIEDTNVAARQHGAQRWRIGYELDAVIREYGVLRRAILQVAAGAGVGVSIEEFDHLSKCLTVGIAEAAQQYVKLRDERSLREQARVEAATRAKDELVAVVSHELRTPLNAILGWTRLMRGGLLSEEKRAHAVEVIERNAEAQNQLISDLLDISKVITGQIRVNPSQVDMGTIVEMAVEGLRPAADAKRIRIDLVLDAEGTTLRGDAERLQQAAWNLVANAVKFTPKDGSVRLTLRRVGSELELVVEDTGEGIAAEFLPHVFESFRQSDGSATRRHGGLGVGLSIARHLVELHGGSITAASPGVGLGATFTLRLPISPLVSTSLGVSRASRSKPRPTALALPGGYDHIEVLIVDDEPDARDILAFVLERCGMRVRSADGATAALEAIVASTPTVLVSDVGMPGNDGYSLVRAVRSLADPAKRNVPAIALTAFAATEDRRKAIEEGFNMHLSKPVEPAVLVQAVVDLARPPKPTAV